MCSRGLLSLLSQFLSAMGLPFPSSLSLTPSTEALPGLSVAPRPGVEGRSLVKRQADGGQGIKGHEGEGPWGAVGHLPYGCPLCLRGPR